MKIKRSLLKYRGEHCLNCGHLLEITDRFCPRCGQLNSTKKLSFDDFLAEFFSNFFSYDSRIRKSLNTLLFHPGKASLEYIKGKRTQYANPFRFYLSISIIFFVTWSIINWYNGAFSFNDNPINNQMSQQDVQELNNSFKNPPVGPAPKEIDLGLPLGQKDSLGTYKKSYFTQKQLDSMPWYNALIKQFDLYGKFSKETNILTAKTGLDSLKHTPSTYNRWVYKKAYDLNTISQNPSIFIGYFLNKMPLIIFFYLPIFALFIWLIYVRHTYNYMEHLIFTFHVQTVFFVLLGIGVLLDFIFGTDFISGLILLVFLYYLYKALRNFYKQGRFKSLVKFLILNVLFLTLAVIAGAISFIISFAIF